IFVLQRNLAADPVGATIVLIKEFSESGLSKGLSIDKAAIRDVASRIEGDLRIEPLPSPAALPPGRADEPSLAAPPAAPAGEPSLAARRAAAPAGSPSLAASPPPAPAGAPSLGAPPP